MADWANRRGEVAGLRAVTSQSHPYAKTPNAPYGSPSSSGRRNGSAARILSPNSSLLPLLLLLLLNTRAATTGLVKVVWQGKPFVCGR